MASLGLSDLIEAALEYSRTGDWLEAAAAYARARSLASHDRRLVNNQGHALWIADLPHAAQACYRRALLMDPGCAIARCGLAHTLRDGNRFEEAAEAYAAAGGAEADWGHSQVLIGLEDYPHAYRLAEARQQLPAWKPHAPPPYWGGVPLLELDPARELEVWSEQGLGDTIQYLRWIPALSLQRRQLAYQRCSEAGELTLLIPDCLVHVVREGLAWMATPPRVLAKEAFPVNEGSAHGPLMSLPHELGGAPLPEMTDQGPLRQLVRYLDSPLWNPGGPSLLPHRESTYSTQAPSVGLVWASGRKLDSPFTHREYRKRSLPARALWTLLSGLQGAGAQLVALQYGNDQHLARAIGLEVPEPVLPLGDFAHVARVVRQLDLVISVDTAMAHVVGAMGAPGWILLPWSADPRWLRERSDSPWYPSLRLFRQPAGGAWQPVIDELLEAFRNWSAAGAG
jgi:hypothetical protein